MSGMAKSKKLSPVSVPTTPINKFRSKSLESDIFFYPRKSRNIHNQVKISEEIDCDSRTIKKEKIVEKANLEDMLRNRKKQEIQ